MTELLRSGSMRGRTQIFVLSATFPGCLARSSRSGCMRGISTKVMLMVNICDDLATRLLVRGCALYRDG